jgi:modification methylase
MRLYSFGAAEGFAGELVLDPFAGTGTTCAVAKAMGRRFIGVDISAAYLEIAAARLRKAPPSPPPLLVGRAKYPSSAELAAMARNEAGSTGRAAEHQHKRKTFGRRAPARVTSPRSGASPRA